MRKLMFAPVLGLSIIAGSLAVTAPASAVTWHNLASDKCLGVADGNKNPNPGQPLIIWDCDGSANQNWTETPFTPDTSFSWFSSTVGNQIGLPVTMFMGITNRLMNNGTKVIDWTKTNDLNQGWQKRFATNDPNGQPCFFFVNKAAPGGPPPARTVVLGVLGGSKDRGAAVVIWDFFKNSRGNPDFGGHPDQYWCQY